MTAAVSSLSAVNWAKVFKSKLHWWIMEHVAEWLKISRLDWIHLSPSWHYQRSQNVPVFHDLLLVLIFGLCLFSCCLTPWLCVCYLSWPDFNHNVMISLTDLIITFGWLIPGNIKLFFHKVGKKRSVVNKIFKGFNHKIHLFKKIEKWNLNTK